MTREVVVLIRLKVLVFDQRGSTWVSQVVWTVSVAILVVGKFFIWSGLSGYRSIGLSPYRRGREGGPQRSLEMDAKSIEQWNVLFRRMRSTPGLDA